MKKQNPISLYLIGFFFCIAAGNFALFFLSPLVFNSYEQYWWIAIVFGCASFIFLFSFIGKVLEFKQIFINIISIIIIACTILHMINRTIHIYSIMAAIVIFCSSMLFFYISHKNKDVKSFGFAIGLIFILIGEPIRATNETSILPFFLYIAASIFFSFGFLEKYLRKNH